MVQSFRRRGYEIGGLISSATPLDLNDPKVMKRLKEIMEGSASDFGTGTAAALPKEEGRTSSGSEGGYAKGGKVRRVLKRRKK